MGLYTGIYTAKLYRASPTSRVSFALVDSEPTRMDVLYGFRSGALVMESVWDAVRWTAKYIGGQLIWNTPRGESMAWESF